MVEKLVNIQEWGIHMACQRHRLIMPVRMDKRGIEPNEFHPSFIIDSYLFSGSAFGNLFDYYICRSENKSKWYFHGAYAYQWR